MTIHRNVLINARVGGECIECQVVEDDPDAPGEPCETCLEGEYAEVFISDCPAPDKNCTAEQGNDFHHHGFGDGRHVTPAESVEGR